MPPIGYEEKKFTGPVSTGGEMLLTSKKNCPIPRSLCVIVPPWR